MRICKKLEAAGWLIMKDKGWERNRSELLIIHPYFSLYLVVLDCTKGKIKLGADRPTRDGWTDWGSLSLQPSDPLSLERTVSTASCVICSCFYTVTTEESHLRRDKTIIWSFIGSLLIYLTTWTVCEVVFPSSIKTKQNKKLEITVIDQWGWRRGSKR